MTILGANREVVQMQKPRFILPLGKGWLLDCNYTMTLKKADQGVVAIGKRGGKIVGYAKGKPVYQKEGGSPKLPENPWRYFKKEPGAQLVPMGQLSAIRARPGGVERAGAHMANAYKTGKGKRGPLELVDHGNGNYTVLDGNSTYANAVKNGWKSIPGVVNAKVSGAAKGLQQLIDAGKHKSKVSEQMAVVTQLVAQHEKSLEGLMTKLKDASPDNAKVIGRVKTIDSALGKLVRKPQNYPSVANLQDMTGSRIMVDTIDQVYAVVKNINKKFDVVLLEDKIREPAGGMKYRSVHLIVQDSDGLEKEIQVRTKEMDTLFRWAHKIYKPETPAQEKVVSQNEDGLIRYTAALSDHVFSKARGDRPPDPPLPKCPIYAQSVFGCPAIA